MLYNVLKLLVTTGGSIMNSKKKILLTAAAAIVIGAALFWVFWLVFYFDAVIDGSCAKFNMGREDCGN